MEKPAVVTISEPAAARIRALVAAEPGCSGLRLSVTTRGCSGHSYSFQRVSEPGKHDERVERDGAVVFVDPLAVMYVWGTEIGWKEDAMQAAFTFTNPNEAGRCGCGESFHVAR